MDKFVEAMQMMAKMTDEEKMKAIDMNKSLCICRACPSYNDCAKENGELLYCSLGSSPTCITEATVCICTGCPVTSKMGLKNLYFCTKGSEKEQRGM
ncbi:MAG: DUF2769 domain-containing protein [Candidatus Bathyarchaeota archaeon]|nr:DUF2769 domain-containing protein [Candidatus Bathyarchaeota archaeon]